MKGRSKRYRHAEKQFDKKKSYSLKEAISILKKMTTSKFDSSVDLDFHLNVDPKQSNQMVRGTVLLPHGTGKKVKIAVFCKGESQNIAQEMQADYVGAEELINKVTGGFLDFDFVIATPEMMKDLARLGKILGPRGLMPSPKTGTVTNDIKKAIEELRKGKIEFKVDKQAGIHVSAGKISFDEEKLFDNTRKLIEVILEARPQTVKGKFVKSLYISTTMNPGISVQL